MQQNSGLGPGILNLGINVCVCFKFYLVFGCAGFCCCSGAFASWGELGLLTAVASLAGTGSGARGLVRFVVHRLSCFRAYRQGRIEPVYLHWQMGFFSTMSPIGSPVWA